MHHVTLRDIPHEDRPRERLQQYGEKALSHAELLAILLRTGTRKESALGLAQRILTQTGGVGGLSAVKMKQLTAIKGIGAAKAVQVLAAIELGRRMSRSAAADKTGIRSPADAAAYIMEDLRSLGKEHFVCLFLDTKNRVIAHETLSIGSLNASIVHPREVFRAAIERGSASIICAHNHPSGDPDPSPEDLQITRRLADAGELVGIEVLDHLIIGDGRFVSLKEQGIL